MHELKLIKNFRWLLCVLRLMAFYSMLPHTCSPPPPHHLPHRPPPPSISKNRNEFSFLYFTRKTLVLFLSIPHHHTSLTSPPPYSAFHPHPTQPPILTHLFFLSLPLLLFSLSFLHFICFFFILFYFILTLPPPPFGSISLLSYFLWCTPTRNLVHLYLFLYLTPLFFTPPTRPHNQSSPPLVYFFPSPLFSFFFDASFFFFLIFLFQNFPPQPLLLRPTTNSPTNPTTLR